MAITVDELVVKLGLDARGFNEGQRKALDQFRRTQAEAAETAKRLEQSARGGMELISALRGSVLRFGGALLGAAGLEHFVRTMTTTNAALGRQAYLLDTNAGELAKWRGAAQLVGGSAEGITASISNLTQGFQQFVATGQSNLIPFFSAMGIQMDDGQRKMKPFGQLLRELSQWASRQDPARANFFLRSIGLDEGTINLIIRGGDQLEQLLAEIDKVGHATDEDAAAAQRLQAAWSAASQATIRFADKILTKLSPALTQLGVDLANVSAKDFKIGGVPIGDLASDIWGGVKRTFTDPGGALSESTGQWGDLLGIKPGAGSFSIGTWMLARSLKGTIPEFDRITAANDEFHAGTGSKHAQGLALDFTLKNQAKSAQVAAEVRAQLKQMGVDATVIDEYLHPSAGSTGGHLHVQFNNAAAADKYLREITHGHSEGGRMSSNTSTVNINGGIHVNAPNATDAQGVGGAIGGAVKQRMGALMAQTGVA